MSQIPDPIETTFETNEGYTFPRRDDAVLTELVEKFNQLVIYLTERKDDSYKPNKCYLEGRS